MNQDFNYVHEIWIYKDTFYQIIYEKLDPKEYAVLDESDGSDVHNWYYDILEFGSHEYTFNETSKLDFDDYTHKFFCEWDTNQN